MIYRSIKKQLNMLYIKTIEQNQLKTHFKKVKSIFKKFIVLAYPTIYEGCC